MAKISFNKPGGAPSMAAAAPVSHAAVASPAPATTPLQTAAPNAAPVEVVPAGSPIPAPMAVATLPPLQPPAPAPFSDDDDTFDPGDLVLPRLNIVQRVGELCNTFPPGTMLLDGQMQLAAAPKDQQIGSAVRIVVLGLQPTCFEEKIEGGGRGEFFTTEAEVVAAGGTLDWNENKRSGKPLYQRVSTGLLLIEQPAGLDAGIFPHEIEGKRYALALYKMKGVAYTNAARHFKSAKKIGFLRDTGYRGGFWKFAVKLEKYGQNYAYRPVVTPAEPTTPTLRDSVQNLLGF